IPSERIIRRIPTGPNQDLLTFSIFASFLTLTSAVYAGLGDRAVEIAADKLHTRTSKTHDTALSQDPFLRDKHGEALLTPLSQDQQITGLAEATSNLTAARDACFESLVQTE